jgi:hypothetical protein
MANNRTLKIIFYQTLVLATLQILTLLLQEYRVVKVVILLALFLWISYQNGRYLFAAKEYGFKPYFKLLLITFFLFELSKIVTYFMGYLPRYTDVPLGIGFVVSFLTISLYLGVLLLLNQTKVIKCIYERKL